MSNDIIELDQQTYLAIPYDQRKQAQESLGQLANGLNAAGFDPDNGLWFAKVGTPISKVKPWLPNPNQFRQPTHQDPTLELASVLQSAGLVLNDLPIFDGAIHRVPTVDDKSGKKSGVYAAYNDGHPSGWYQDHRNHSEPQKWHASFEQSDPVAKLHIKAHQANQRSLREITEHKRYTHHAKRSAQAFQLMQPAATNHPYLTRKGVQAFPSVSQDKKGRLVIPLMDNNQQIHSMQRISGNGFKSLKKGAQKSGHFFVVGVKPLTNGEPILYAEGYSTAASIAQGTGRSVVMTVDAGNMPKVAVKLKQHYPESQHLFLADDDHKNKTNKGLEKAREAAAITNGHWLSPSFIIDEREHGMTDFNDLHVSRGVAVVKHQIDEFIIRCWPEISHNNQPQEQSLESHQDISQQTYSANINSIEHTQTNDGVVEQNKQTHESSNSAPLPWLASLNKFKNDVNQETTDIGHSVNTSVTSMDKTESNDKKTEDRNKLPELIKQKYIEIQNKYYFSDRPQTLAFIDKGNKLQTQSVQTKVIKDLLEIASSRNWNEIKLTGSNSFKREAWYHAKLQGITVNGYQPDQHDLARHAGHQKQLTVSQANRTKTASSQEADRSSLAITTQTESKKKAFNEIEAIKEAKEFSNNLNPPSQKLFMTRVKKWIQERVPKYKAPDQQFENPKFQKTQVNQSEVPKPIKEQQYEHELER